MLRRHVLTSRLQIYILKVALCFAPETTALIRSFQTAVSDAFRRATIRARNFKPFVQVELSSAKSISLFHRQRNEFYELRSKLYLFNPFRR